MLTGEDILIASNGTRLLYLLATCGAAAVGSWLYQKLFSLPVTRDEMIASVLFGVIIYIFFVGMFVWHLYAALGFGFVGGFGLTHKLEWLNEKDRDNTF